MAVRIRIRRNGPYVIDADDVDVVDWNGVVQTCERKPVALCRCGASGTKPFCDGSHARIGFQGDGEAHAPDHASSREKTEDPG